MFKLFTNVMAVIAIFGAVWVAILLTVASVQILWAFTIALSRGI